MSRRSVLQQLERERLENYDPEKELDERILALHKKDLYHMNGIAKLCGCSYRRVRKVIRGE